MAKIKYEGNRWVSTNTKGIYYDEVDKTFRIKKTFGKLNNGKPNRITGSAKTEKEANALLKKKIKEFENRKVDTNKITLDGYANIYFERKEKNGEASKETIRQQKVRYSNNISPYLGNRRIQSISPLDVQCWQDEMQKEITVERANGTVKTAPRLSNNTIVRSVKPILHGIMESAETDELIEKNPVKKKTNPKVQKDTVKPFSRGEVLALLQTANESPNRNALPACMLFAYLGLRIGEVQGLKWQDIDFENKRINIVRQFRASDRSIAPPKTESSIRENIMPSELSEYLFSIRGKDNEYIIHPNGDTKKPLSRKAFELSLQTIARHAGVREFKSHRFRHAFATMAIEGGASLTAVMGSMGHSDIKTTGNTYVDKNINIVGQATNAVANLLEFKPNNKRSA